MIRWRTSLSMAAASGLLLAATVHSSWAQPADDVRTQVQRLQRDMSDLQREVFRNQPQRPGAAMPPPNYAPAPVPDMAATQRVNDIEESLRQITGRLEELGHQLDELAQKNDRLQRQVDFLEKGRDTAPAGLANDLGPDVNGNGPQDLALNPPPRNVTPQYEFTLPPVTPLNSPPFREPPPSNVLGNLREAPPRAAPPPPTGAGDPAAEYDSAMGLLARAQYDQARGAFRAFADTHNGNELAPTALYWTGDIAYSMQRDYAGAARDFAELLKKYPGAPRAPEGMLKLGLSLLALGQKQEGCAALAALPAKYPNANPTIVNRSRVERRTVGCV